MRPKICRSLTKWNYYSDGVKFHKGADLIYE